MCCSKTCIYRLVLMVPFQMCQLPISYTLMGPPCHQRCRFLNLALVLSRVVPLIFSSRDALSMFQNKCPISVCLTTEQFSIFSQSILNELWSKDDSSIVGSCSYVASFFWWWSFNVSFMSIKESCLFLMPGWPEDHRHPMLVFSLVPCTRRFLLIEVFTILHLGTLF